MEMYNVSLWAFWFSRFLIRLPFITFLKDENRLKTNVYEVKEINYKEHNERLIREMKEMAASEWKNFHV